MSLSISYHIKILENNTVLSNNDVSGQQQQKRSSSLGDDITGNNNNQKQQQQQMSLSTTNNNNNNANFVAPRKEWSHRIYFNNIVKPGRFVDFKMGQKELMKEIMGLLYFYFFEIFL